MADFSSIPTLTQGDSDMDDINEWWSAVNRLYHNDRESFDAYAASDPSMAIRYHARGALDDVNSGTSSEEHANAAQMLSYQEATRLGWGSDMKQDGKMVAWNYDDWNDISNEWGKGDFWKIGTPSAMNGGLMDFLEDNPLQVAGIVGSVFIPMMAPAIATTLGVSNAVASGLLSAGISAGTGGDIGDVVTAGLTSWGLGELAGWADSQLASAVDTNPQLAEAQKVLDGAGVAMEGGQVDGNMIVNFANDVVPGTIEAGATTVNPSGIGVIGAYGELQDAYQDWSPDGASGSYDMPILDQPGGVEQNPDAGGANPVQGPTQGATGMDPDGNPYPEEIVAAGSQEHWDAQPAANRAWWNSLSQEQKDQFYQGVADSNTPQGEESQDRDEWVYNNGVLTNNVTGAQREGGANMENGGLYRGDGDRIGDTQDEEDLLVAGGAPRWNHGIQRDDRDPYGLLDYGYGSQSPGTGTGQGATDGTGVGSGNQAGVDTDPASPSPDGDINIPPIIPVPPIDNSGGNSYNGSIPPQDMSTQYEKPTYAPAEQRPLLAVPDNSMRAPMITPADNSGQASYDEWLDDYLKQPRTQEGLLPMIAGKQTTGGLI